MLGELTTSVRLMLATFCVASVLAAAGCASGKPKTYPVKGKVVYKGSGEPAVQLAGGAVVFEPAEPAQVVRGEIDEDGNFAIGSVIGADSVGGALPGEYRVRISPPTDEDTGRAMRTVLAPQYRTFDQSGLKVTVVAGGNEDVTLEVERPRR